MGHDQKICKKVFSLFLGSSCRETPKNAIKKIRKKEKKRKKGRWENPRTHEVAAGKSTKGKEKKKGGKGRWENPRTHEVAAGKSTQ